MLPTDRIRFASSPGCREKKVRLPDSKMAGNDSCTEGRPVTKALQFVLQGAWPLLKHTVPTLQACNICRVWTLLHDVITHKEYTPW